MARDLEGAGPVTTPTVDTSPEDTSDSAQTESAQTENAVETHDEGGAALRQAPLLPPDLHADIRTALIEAYDVLDGPPRKALVALVELAARAAGVDYAQVNLFTADTQHSVATVGSGPDSPKLTLPREDALCNTVLLTERPYLVEDAQTDPVFASVPFTKAANLHFYGAHPLRTPSGVVIGTLCVFEHEARPVTVEAAEMLNTLADRVVDVLELELASRRLNEANTRLSTSNERLARFAGQVSHDLKNPLTSVSLSLEALEVEVTDPYHVDTLARARRGLDRMGVLISDLLDFAATGDAPGDDPVDLSAEIEAALDDLVGKVSRDHVALGLLPVVRGDGPQLRSVLMNLIDNSVKFTAAGEEPEIEVVALRVDDRVRIEVRDRGRGIASDKCEAVFSPLARLDRAVEGVGLGLATCRRIIEAHGGRIGIVPRRGGGVVCWFELPAADLAEL